MSVSRETAGSTHISELIDKEVPVIFFDRVFNEINTVKITTNDFESAYAATTHLIKSGCKNPHFASIIGNLNIISCRMEGYKKALEENGIPFSDNNIINCNTNFEHNYNSILKKPERLKAA